MSEPRFTEFAGFSIGGNTMGKNLVKSALAVSIFCVLVAIVSCSEKSTMGYEQVKWGVSVKDVRKAFNLEDDIILQENYEDDSNLAALIQKNVSESITERMFLFNKWNSTEYRLYRVWVEYRTITDENEYKQLVQNVQNLLTERFGEATMKGSQEYRGKYSPDIYGKYSPELVVELIREEHPKAFYVDKSGKRVYIDMSDRDAVLRATISRTPQHYYIMEHVLKVCYTWKKFRDSYKARNVGL